jgi:hypothetical protein
MMRPSDERVLRARYYEACWSVNLLTYLYLLPACFVCHSLTCSDVTAYSTSQIRCLSLLEPANPELLTSWLSRSPLISTREPRIPECVILVCFSTLLMRIENTIQVERRLWLSRVKSDVDHRVWPRSRLGTLASEKLRRHGMDTDEKK